MQKLVGEEDLQDSKGLAARLQGVQLYNPQRTPERMERAAKKLAGQLCAQGNWQVWKGVTGVNTGLGY